MSRVTCNNFRHTNGNDIPDGLRLRVTHNFTNSNRTLSNNSGWVNHLTGNISLSKRSNVVCINTLSHTYEAGRVEGFCRLVFGGTNYFGSCQGRQMGNNSGGAGGCTWLISNVNAGNYSYQLQARNWINGTTWIMNYWSPDQNYTRDTVTFWYQ